MNIPQKVVELLKTFSGSETIHPTDSLQKDIGLDSLGMVTLLIELEETFRIHLKETDMNPFDLSTVADVVTLVGKYIKGDCDEKED